MRWFTAVYLIGCCASGLNAWQQPSAPMPPLEQLFTRPYVWGTAPSSPKWSKNGRTLCFLWNASGNRFLDLYSYSPASKKMIRLTDLASLKDDPVTSDEEKDERLKKYQLPAAGLAGFSMSDDGSRAVFTYKGDLYIASADNSKPLFRLTRTKAAESSPQFSPDGKQLASLRGGILIVQDLQTGQTWQAVDLESGNLNAYQWSPDGKHFLLRVSKGGGRQLPLPNYSGRFVTARPFPRNVAGDEGGEQTVHIVPSDGSAKPRAIDRGGDKWSASDVEWSPDSKRILIGQLSPDWKKRRLLTIDVKTAKSTQVFEETDSRWTDYGFAGWSEDGSEVLFTADKEGFSHLHKVKADGSGQAFRITSGGYEIRRDSFATDPQWAGGWIWFSSTEGDTAQRQFWKIRPDGTGKQKLSSGEGMRIATVSGDGRHVAEMRADEKTPFDLYVDGARITTSVRPGFASIPWPRVQYATFPSKGDGKPVAAKILLPPGYNLDDKSGKKWPAVVYVHGAGIATSVLKQWGSYNEYRYVFNAWLTHQGYLVLDLDYRGSTGYGRDWRTDVYLHMGGKDLDDVLGGVEYLKTLGNVDTTKLGTWGVSYGGFMTAASLFHAPGTFKAGAAWAGVYDWENYNGGYTSQRLNTPASNPEAYKRSSPIWFSNQLQDHLLIVHGMGDTNVLFQEAVQLTEKLIHEGKQKNFEHAYYPEENHGFARDESWIDAFSRTAAWFERHLK